MTQLQYDVVIVGGGLVGMGLAAALHPAGCKVALLEAKPAHTEAQDPRLFALNHSSCQFLANLGVWPSLAEHATPIRTVHVSNQGQFAAVRLRAEDMALPALGHVVPARWIEAALYARVQALPHCTIYRPAVLQSLRLSATGPELSCMTDEGEKTLRTSLLTGADGTESMVRNQLPIQTETSDYDQSAIVTTTSLKRHHQHIAYERFNPQGAIAMLPLVGNQCATIWTTENKHAARLMEMPDDLFVQQLQQELGYRLGRLGSISARHVFPLRKVQAIKSVENGVYLLGNAAHTLHPIAAQGLNLALYEAAALAEKIIAQARLHATLNQIDLEQLQASVQKQQAISIGTSHRLATLFTGRSILFNLFLSLGMLGFDLAVPLKKRFMNSLMGRTECYF